MATAGQVISAGLKSIIVLGAEADLESVDADDFIFAMNNFMADLAVKGVDLGYTEVDTVNDEITIPVGALRGLIANVAIEVAPDYGGVVSPQLQVRARDGLRAMRRLSKQIGSSSYPSTLPVGSGNEGRATGFDSSFYAGGESAILAEASRLPFALIKMTSNASESSITSALTPILVNGTWSIERSFGLSATTAGRIVYTGDEDIILPISVKMTAKAVTDPGVTAGLVISFYVAVNGVIETQSRRQAQVKTSPGEDIKFEFKKKLEKNDYVEVYVANDVSTDNVLVTDAQIRVN